MTDETKGAWSPNDGRCSVGDLNSKDKDDVVGNGNASVCSGGDGSNIALDMRVGTGWDVHRLEEGRPLVLGGVKVESPKGSIAHSDGDALIHAIIDAILGACALDDIGTMFPDDDPAYKDADSSVLLENVVAKAEGIGFRVHNVDATVVLQQPRLGPYKDAMKECLADALHIEPCMVGVKAKTAEGILGELGRGDAVMAQAVVLLVRR